MKRRPKFSIEQREKILNELEQSELSVTEFARRNGLSRVLLSVWLSRYRGKAVPSPITGADTVCVGGLPLQEIPLGQLVGQPQTAWAAEVVFTTGVRLRLDQQGRDRLLGHLLGQGEGPC